MLPKRLSSALLTATLVASIALNPSVVLAATTGNLYPSSNGTYLNWNIYPTAGTPYVVLNDYGQCNTYNDYVITNQSNVRESVGFNIGSIPDGSKIRSIDVIPCAEASTSSQPLAVFYRLRSNGQSTSTEGIFPTVDYIGTSRLEYATTTYSWPSASMPTKTSSSTLEIGVYRPSVSGNSDLKVHQLRVIVNY